MLGVFIAGIFVGVVIGILLMILMIAAKDPVV